VNELWLRNLKNGGWKIDNRHHFYAIISIALRHVLIDLARQRLAQSRGSGQTPASLDESQAASLASSDNLEQIVKVGVLMERLQAQDRLGALIADMHYFAGYSFPEIAKATGLNVRQVIYRWKKAEAWLKKQLMA